MSKNDLIEVKLKDAFELQMGKTPARNNSQYWDGNNKWISIADIGKAGKFISDTKECITDSAVAKSGIKAVPKGTLIMSFKLSIGKTAITAENMFTNEAIMAFIDKGVYDIDINYLYHYFTSMDWSAGSNKAVMGMTLNKATLSEKKIRIPDVKTQKAIACRLDKVEELINIKKEELENLEMLVKARFVELFGDIQTGEYKFETRKLGEVAVVGSSHRVFTTEFVEEGIPFYRGTEIGELANGIKPENPYRITKEHYDRLASDETKPKVGDLLMPSICNKGQVWMVDTDEPFYYKDGRVLCISPNRKLFNCKYLEQFMREKTLVEYPKLGSGSTFAEFKIFLLKDIDILIPPIELQNQFAAFVEQTDKSKLIVKKQLEELETLKRSLIQKYFG